MNVVNGVTDIGISILNLPAAMTNGIASVEEYLGILPDGSIRVPYIPAPDWSYGLIVQEDQASHDWSKWLGGNGVVILGTLALGAAMGNIGSHSSVSSEVVLAEAESWLGPGYAEISPGISPMSTESRWLNTQRTPIDGTMTCSQQNSIVYSCSSDEYRSLEEFPNARRPVFAQLDCGDLHPRDTRKQKTHVRQRRFANVWQPRRTSVNLSSLAGLFIAAVVRMNGRFARSPSP
ncbi:MAG: hypothetical protein R3C49_15070 [Planctomycetaceae bacterium]